MKIKKMETLQDIRQALDSKQTVYWANSRYLVHYVDQFEHCSPFTLKDGKLIRASDKDSYFGSLLSASEITACYVEVTNEPNN